MLDIHCNIRSVHRHGRELSRNCYMLTGEHSQFPTVLLQSYRSTRGNLRKMLCLFPSLEMAFRQTARSLRPQGTGIQFVYRIGVLEKRGTFLGHFGGFQCRTERNSYQWDTFRFIRWKSDDTIYVVTFQQTMRLSCY